MVDIISMYQEYVRHFTRDDYSTAYRKYKSECSVFFETLTENQVDETAAQIMNLAEKEISRRRFGRKVRCFDMRSFFCVYLCPAAMDFGTEQAQSLACAIAEKWNAEYPEYRFEVGRYKDIAEGFRTKPFSF